jgi:5-(carboxyamino)imidazole ribonucleotide mutase
MPKVIIILGSETDLEKVEASGMLEILNAMEVAYELSIISAHRHPVELKEYVRTKTFSATEDSTIFIAAAGMAAHLPGTIAAHTRGFPVIGVALSDDTLKGVDAMYSISRMPKGVPVAYTGIDKHALINAAILACQMIALTNHIFRGRLEKYLRNTLDKSPQIAVRSNQEPILKEVSIGDPA